MRTNKSCDFDFQILMTEEENQAPINKVSKLLKVFFARIKALPKIPLTLLTIFIACVIGGEPILVLVIYPLLGALWAFLFLIKLFFSPQGMEWLDSNSGSTVSTQVGKRGGRYNLRVSKNGTKYREYY